MADGHDDGLVAPTVCVLLLHLLLLPHSAAIPSDPLYFRNRVDHFGAGTGTYQQRYYANESAFGGAGSPFLVILGGEGAIPPSTGLFYPFVVDVLAPQLGAMVLEPEHRFYGESQPVEGGDRSLLTPQQALADTAFFISSMRKRYNCSGEAGEPRCPVVTIGGSYPGWLSAMMRLRYPNVVDIGYAASAPMKFYAQQVDQYAYYQRVSQSAENAVAGCNDAVRTVLAETLTKSKEEMIEGLGLCMPLPSYLEEGDNHLLAEELAMVVQYSFAGLNMGNYPPPDTLLKQACESLVASVSTPWDALRSFLEGYSISTLGQLHQSTANLSHEKLTDLTNTESDESCYNLSSQLPSGPNATISSGDWSGVGTGENGESWDYETCTFLVEAIGTNNVTDMFPPRPWSLEWMQAHCSSRFGPDQGVPRPRVLADLWGFDRLEDTGASRIIFTNGMTDGWSVGGITSNLSDTLVAINIADGAHHSDLSHTMPSDADTEAVKQAREYVSFILQKWLKEID